MFGILIPNVGRLWRGGQFFTSKNELCRSCDLFFSQSLQDMDTLNVSTRVICSN